MLTMRAWLVSACLIAGFLSDYGLSESLVCYNGGDTGKCSSAHMTRYNDGGSTITSKSIMTESNLWNDDKNGPKIANTSTMVFAVNFTESWDIVRARVMWTSNTLESDSDSYFRWRNNGSDWVFQSTGVGFTSSSFATDKEGRFGYDEVTSTANTIWADSIEIGVSFASQVPTSSSVVIDFVDLQGEHPTNAPTVVPTVMPSNLPTINPTDPTVNPTINPSLVPSSPPSNYPSKAPTVPPTTGPTQAPTFNLYLQETPWDEDSNQCNFTYSDNIYPLSYRNETYSSFTVPGNKAYCSTCILAWSNIDANIWVEGCNTSVAALAQSEDDGYLESPGEFYYCNGTWIIETSGSLVDWQQTYGRLEIWEVDDWGRKYSQIYFEFQWNTSRCNWTENGVTDACDVLPLTGSVSRAAMFRFTMPKLVTDNRRNPLIVVWYDLLGVPYSLRPELNYQFTNLNWTDYGYDDDLGLEEVVTQFELAIWAAGALLLAFVIVMVIACVAADDAILKADYMLDTRDLRTTYIHSVTTLIAPQSDLKRRSKFSIKRHGFWLLVVLGARLVYMFVFTFTFFYLVFQLINNDSFNMLDRYDAFANERDSQLTNISADIETYYNNETDRMESEVESRSYWCYTVYINETAKLWNEGAEAQYSNHSKQMENSLNSVDFGNYSTGLYLSGSTACDITSANGASVAQRDPYTKVYYKPNGDFNYSVSYYAWQYDRNRTTGAYNFSYLTEILSDVCNERSWCNGWTWIDGYYDNETNTTYNNSYYFLEELADPINSELDGVCYAMSEFDSSLFEFDSVEALKNYTDYLESLYLSNYVSDVDSMYDTLSGLWDSIKSMSSDEGDHEFIVTIDTSAEDFDMSVELGNISVNFNGDGTYDMTSIWYVVVSCPGCPEGNFSNAYLEQLADYLFTYNYSNISDFVNTVGGNAVNFSDLVSVNTALIDYPDVPEIDLPFDFDFVDLSFLEILSTITLTLDTILFIYRWYRTAGIIATIVRGKDVEIRLRYLKTEVAPPPPCWNGQELFDKCLNSIIWCHDKIRHCGYNVWRFMYWIWVVFQLCILVLIILMMYIVVDNVASEDFITSLGTFDLLTVGIAAQRSIRNEVICTTALAYNNYTLDLLIDSRTTYAEEKNEDAWDWNVDELDRVDDYNSYFCTAYTAYQATVRDVSDETSGSFSSDGLVSTTFEELEDAVQLAFDGSTSTSLSISSDTSFNGTTGTTLSIYIELPGIQMTSHSVCYWELSKLEFDWSVNASDLSIKTATFTVEAKFNDSDSFERQSLSASSYAWNTYVITNDEETNNVDWGIVVRYLRVNFSNVDDWVDRLYLNELSFYGSADEDCIACDQVTFYYWDFDATDTYIALCPSVTPIHGIMYRGFVRSRLTTQLKAGHRPFILALRNIALSPFAILLVASIILVLVYLLAFVVEYILLRVNLYRENPYAKVPLVHAKNSDFYDPTMHDIDNKTGHNRDDGTTYFGNSGSGIGGSSVGGTNDALASTGSIKPAHEIENEIGVELQNISTTMRNAKRATEMQRTEDKQNATSYLAGIGVQSAQNRMKETLVPQSSVTAISQTSPSGGDGYGDEADSGNYHHHVARPPPRGGGMPSPNNDE